MASNFWIKLYHEILHDPKMGKLPDNVWRRAIELFLLAGELDDGGKLPDTEDLSWHLHRPSMEELETELAHLEKVEILTRLEDGWLVTKFAERQKAIGDAERAKAYRDRKRRQIEPETQKSNGTDTTELQERHESVTKRDTDIDIDKEILPKGNSGKKPQVGSEKWNNANKKVVGDKFLELTQLKPPTNDKTKGAWWGWLYEIFEMAGKDAAETCRVMGIVVGYMRGRHTDITSPKSLISYSRVVVSGQELGGDGVRNNGPARASPKPVGEINLETLRKLQEEEKQ